MRLVRFSVDGSESLGVLLGDSSVVSLRTAAATMGMDLPEFTSMRELIEAGPTAWSAAEAVAAAAAEDADAVGAQPLAGVQLHHPYRPRKNIVRAGGNARMEGDKPREYPLQKLAYFTKAPTAVLDPGASISWPTRWAEQVYAEPQLAIVVGKKLSYATPAQCRAGVFGYAVATDVTSYDLRVKHAQWPKGSSLDTFFPWGPIVVTADEVPDPDGLTVSLYLNGDLAVEGSTRDSLLGVGEMLSQVSFGITLEPGDVLLLGTPESVGFGERPERWLGDGDVVRSHIPGIGELTNPVHPT